MKPVTKLKCGKCQTVMHITHDNIDDLVFYKNKYYHTDCFVELASGRVAKETSNSLDWQVALNNLCRLKQATKIRVLPRVEQGDLNDYLLYKYSLTTLPNRFWEMINQLEKGEYKGKSCRPISAGLLLKAWIWGQNNLDKIHQRNKSKNKGPKTNLDRINYDFSIILNHIGDYEKYVAKLEVEEAERKAQEKHVVNIDYNKVQIKKESNGLDDIGDLLDDLI